ncbi:MAG: hypothetical protein SFW63_09145 [Alphaproteobacteria bacterium]|nr:hypothetical protein [Alphaproteobacteria bacterium]
MPLTLQDLKEATSQARFNRKELISLIEEHGLVERGGNNNWGVPGRADINPVYIPDYTEINSTVWNKLLRIMEQLEKEKAPTETAPKAPQWLHDELKNMPEWELDESRLGEKSVTLRSKAAPEFAFDVPLSGNDVIDKKTFDLYVQSYAGSEKELLSLTKYLKLLSGLDENEWKLERSAQGTKLVSQMQDIPDIELTGRPDQLIKKTNDAKEYAELYRNDLAKNPAAAPEPASPAPPEPEIRAAKKLAPGAVKSPEEGQHVLILDSSAIIELGSFTFGKNGNKTSLLDIVKATQKLPNVSKIIIPDYVADFEVRGQGTHYDEKGQLLVSESIHDKKNYGNDYKDVRDNFQRLIHNAVRRHVAADGTVEFLHNADVPAEQVNTSIVIWETPKGREYGEDIYTKLNAGKVQEVFDSYVSKPDDRSSRNNYGEQQIEAICNDRDFYAAPVHIITSDRNYIRESKNNKTANKQNKAYRTTFEYLDAELSSRGQEHRNKIGMSFQNAKEAYEYLLNDSNGKMGKVQDDSRHITSPIRPLIQDGILAAEAAGAAAAASRPTVTPAVAPRPTVALKPVRVPVVPAATPAPTAVPTPAPVPPPAARTLDVSPEGRAFGDLLLRLMNDRDLNRSGFAKLINENLPPDQSMDIQTVRGILSGKEPVSEALLEVIETIAIDQNPQINNKEDAKQELRQAWDKACAQQTNMASRQAVDSAGYHGFGDKVAALFEKRNVTDPEKIASAIREQIGVLKPTEPTIDSALIQKIFDGEHLPSPGLAAALRKALDNPPGFDDAYQKARSAKPQPQELSKLREKIKKHFTDLDETLGLNDIGVAGRIGQKRNVGSLLGKGGNVSFDAEQLGSFGSNLSGWMERELGATPTQVAAFQADWELFSRAYLEEQQKKQLSAAK